MKLDLTPVKNGEPGNPHASSKPAKFFCKNGESHVGESEGESKSTEILESCFSDHCIFCLRSLSSLSESELLSFLKTGGSSDDLLVVVPKATVSPEFFSSFIDIVSYILKESGTENSPNYEFSRLPAMCHFCAEKAQEVEKRMNQVKLLLNNLMGRFDDDSADDFEGFSQYYTLLARYERQLESFKVENDVDCTKLFENYPDANSEQVEINRELGQASKHDGLEEYFKPLALWRSTKRCWRSPWRKRVFATMITSVLVVIVAVGLFTSGVHYTCSNQPAQNDSEVESDKLFISSWDLLEDTNSTVDPCDNFYHFACQDWHRKNPRPENARVWSTFTVLDDEMDRIIIDILQQPSQRSDIPAFKQAQKFYRNCLKYMSTVDEDDSALAALVFLFEKVNQYGNALYKRKSSIWGTQKVCVYYTMEIFKFPVSQKYLRKIYKTRSKMINAKNEVSSLANDLKETLELYLQEVGGKSEILISSKMRQIKVCLGYPSWLFIDSRVQREYEELDLSQSTFPAQFLNAIVWLLKGKIDLKEKLSSDNREAKQCHWTTFPGGVETYFDPELFQIYVPMGQIYDSLSKYGDHLTGRYGVVGFALTHEFSHVLFTLGYRTNENDTLTSPEECFAKQYSSYTVNQLENEEIRLDGEGTLQENFADNLGLAIAYRAFKNAEIKEKGTKNKNTTYNNDQLFFLKFAEDLCAGVTAAEMEEQMSGHDHSPGMFRVLGTLENSNEFAKAWNCPVGSKMNTDPSDQEKCSMFSR